MESLTKKTSVGIIWSALERLGCQVAGFAIQILLARIIDPTEFGLLALLTIFIIFSQMIIDGGFGQAIIQKAKVERPDISTVFFFNFLLSILMYGAIFLLAPRVAEFYSEPRLVVLLRVLGINLLINALGKIQYCLLIRGLQFKRLFKITLPAMTISGVIGIAMALLGFEVWALVAFQISNALVSNVCYWWMSDREMWPCFEFSWTSLVSMARFGIGILGGSLLFQFVTNAYGLLIGKAFSFDQLAFYNRARSFHQLPAGTLTQVLNRVLFPVFSTIQNDDRRILQAVRRGIPIVAFVVFPLMTFLMCAAEEIVVVLLTDKWLASVQYMRWFPILGMLYPIAAVQLAVIRAKGWSGFYFFMDLIKNSIAIGTLIFTIQHGVLTVVVGQVLAGLFCTVFINVPAFNYVYKYHPAHQLADVLPYFAVSVVAIMAALVSDMLLVEFSTIVTLAIKAVAFFLTYFYCCWLTKLNGLNYFVERFVVSNAAIKSL